MKLSENIWKTLWLINSVMEGLENERLPRQVFPMYGLAFVPRREKYIL